MQAKLSLPRGSKIPRTERAAKWALTPGERKSAASVVVSALAGGYAVNNRKILRNWGQNLNEAPRKILYCCENCKKKKKNYKLQHSVRDHIGRQILLCSRHWKKLATEYKYYQILQVAESGQSVGRSGFGFLDQNGEQNMKAPQPQQEERTPFLGAEDARKMGGDGKLIAGKIVSEPIYIKTVIGYRVFVQSKFGNKEWIVSLNPERLSYARLYEKYGGEFANWKGKRIRVGVAKTKAGDDFLKVEA